MRLRKENEFVNRNIIDELKKNVYSLFICQRFLKKYFQNKDEIVVINFD